MDIISCPLNYSRPPNVPKIDKRSSIDEIIKYAETNKYNQFVIEKLKDYRALLMIIANDKK